MNIKQVVGMWCGIAIIVFVTMLNLSGASSGDAALAVHQLGRFLGLVVVVGVVTGGLMATLADKNVKKP